MDVHEKRRRRKAIEQSLREAGQSEVCPRCNYEKKTGTLCTRCALWCPQPGQGSD